MWRHNFATCLSTLLLAGSLSSGCTSQDRPPTARNAGSARLSESPQAPGDQPEAQAKVIATWTLEPGAGGGGDPSPVFTLVSVTDDGRVRVNRSLFHPGQDASMIEGTLTADQLDRFRNGLRKMTDGLAGQHIQRATPIHFSSLRFMIDLPGIERTTLESGFRYVELALGTPPRVYWPKREGSSDKPELTRFEKLSQNFDPAELAMRETFIAVEAEFLRAAAQALANRDAP